jgi:hypothetical protein
MSSKIQGITKRILEERKTNEYIVIMILNIIEFR